MSALYELTYDSAIDMRIFEQMAVDLGGGASANISMATVAGRREADDPQKPNEDAISVVEAQDGVVCAVFDGASSQKPIPELGGVSGARFASHSLKELLEAEPFGDMDTVTALCGLNWALGQR